MGLLSGLKGMAGDFVSGTFADGFNPVSGLANVGMGLLGNVIGQDINSNPAGKSMNQTANAAIQLAQQQAGQQQQQFGVEQPFRQQQLGQLLARGQQEQPNFAAQQAQLFNPFLNVNRVRPNFGPAGLSLGRSGMAGPSPFQTIQGGPQQRLGPSEGMALMGIPQEAPNYGQIEQGTGQSGLSPADLLKLFMQKQATTTMGQGGLVAANDEELLDNRSNVTGQLIDPNLGQTVWDPDSSGMMMPDDGDVPLGGYVTRTGHQLDGSVLSNDQIDNLVLANRAQADTEQRFGQPEHPMTGLFREMNQLQRLDGRPGTRIPDFDQALRADQQVVDHANSVNSEGVQRDIAAAITAGSGQSIVPQGGDTFAILGPGGNVINTFNRVEDDEVATTLGGVPQNTVTPFKVNPNRHIQDTQHGMYDYDEEGNRIGVDPGRGY
jgi:hypothetical protein